MSRRPGIPHLGTPQVRLPARVLNRTPRRGSLPETWVSPTVPISLNPATIYPVVQAKNRGSILYPCLFLTLHIELTAKSCMLTPSEHLQESILFSPALLYRLGHTIMPHTCPFALSSRLSSGPQDFVQYTPFFSLQPEWPFCRINLIMPLPPSQSLNLSVAPHGSEDLLVKVLGLNSLPW